MLSRKIFSCGNYKEKKSVLVSPIHFESVSDLLIFCHKNILLSIMIIIIGLMD